MEHPWVPLAKTRLSVGVAVKATKDTRYYFAVTAYHDGAKENAKSIEVSKIINGTTGTTPVASKSKE
jgi:hypothetical protein